MVVSVDGRPVEDPGHLRNELAGAEVGAVICGSSVLRNGRHVDLRIPVEEVRRGA